jgi:hypothetical protein
MAKYDYLINSCFFVLDNFLIQFFFLNREFSRFDALLATFQQLAEQALFTLRVELRCHTLHYIDKAMREVISLIDIFGFLL